MVKEKLIFKFIVKKRFAFLAVKSNSIFLGKIYSYWNNFIE
jgi:hypothetical protein